MSHFRRKIRRIKTMDLIPMINIVFLLLLFFIIAGTLKPSDEITVDIPLASSDSEVKGNPVLLVLSRGGKITFDGIYVTEENLPWMIKQALEKDSSILISIRADRRLPAKSLTKLISIVQKSGGSNMSIEVEKS